MIMRTNLWAKNFLPLKKAPAISGSAFSMASWATVLVNSLAALLALVGSPVGVVGELGAAAVGAGRDLSCCLAPALSAVFYVVFAPDGGCALVLCGYGLAVVLWVVAGVGEPPPAASRHPGPPSVFVLG